GAIIGIVLLGNIFSPVLAQETKPSSKIAIRPVPDFNIEVWIDKGCGKSYTVGENITIYFKSNKDCYLTLFDLTPGGGIRLLFPNRYEKNNFLEANKVHTIPPGFVVTPPPGKEMIRAIATTSSWQFFSDEEIMRYHSEHPEERYPVISRSEEGFAAKFNEKIKIIPQPNRAMASCIFNVISKVVPQYGKIKVTSTPSYAKVYLDGVYHGKTPITLSNVKVGKHTIKVTKKDYYNYSETVQVKGSSTTYVFARLEPVPKTGSIYINSTPSNAKVHLAGAYRGRTPLTISNLEIGEYQIKISKDDYYDWYSTVRVKQNITTQVFAQLEPIPRTGSLYVTSSPSYARVFLDGIEQRTTPLTITDIEEGWHEVVIIKEYYRAYVEYLYIYAGEQSEVEADLDRI
ncbi:PEGA domain-containing protein, partial [Candidatus Aerophobetes bacterium]|nr:PEGA domain-containing protein [Candidatus Aerophobetes bacterium]